MTITDSNPVGVKNCPMDHEYAPTTSAITLKTLSTWPGGKWFTSHCEKKYTGLLVSSAPTPPMWGFFFTIVLGLCSSTNDNTSEIAYVDTIANGVSKLLAHKLKTFAVVAPAAAEVADEEVGEKQQGDEEEEEEEEEDGEEEDGEEEEEAEEAAAEGDGAGAAPTSNKRSRDSAEEAAAEGDGAAAVPTSNKRRRDSVARSTTTSAAHSSASSAASSSARTKPSSQGPAANKCAKGKTTLS